MEHNDLLIAVDKNRPIVYDENSQAYLLNLDVVGRPRSVLYLLILTVIIGVAGIFYLRNDGRTEPLNFLPQTVLLFLMFAVWITRKCMATKPNNWLSPDTFFVTVFSIFHFAYIFYYSLGLADYEKEVFYSPTKVMRATYFCFCCLYFFLVGYEWCRSKQDYVDKSKLSHLPPVAIIIPKVFIIVAIIFFWGAIFTVGFGTLMQDYKLMTRIGYFAGGRFFWVSYNIALVGICLYCALSGLIYQKFMYGKLCMILAFFYIGGVLLLGDRGGFLYFATIPVMAYHFFQKRIKFWIAFALALGLLLFMGIIRQARSISLLDVDVMKQVAGENKVSDIIQGTILEYGVTIKTVTVAMDLVPKEHNYWYGKSYLANWHLIIPNIIPGMVRESKGIVLWLTETAFGSLATTHGRGGSIAMEAYVNFGFVGGAISFLFLGLFYRYLYEKFLLKPNLVRTVLLFATTSVIMLWIRNSMSICVRGVTWSFILAWLVSNLCKENKNS